MSAIWGAIARTEELSDIQKKMDDAMSVFKLDKVDSISRGNAFFSCGHQFFTLESNNDVSPFFDEEKGVLFVGDCFLINRDELIEGLCTENRTLARNELLNKGDVQLAYLAYAAFGEDFVTKLCGSFAFGVYEINSKRLLLYTDHTAQRYLAYYLKDNRLFFAQVYQPFLAVLEPNEIEIDEEWLVSAFADCSADTIKIPGRSVFDNIIPIEPGTYTVFDLSSFQKQKKCYWNPVKSVGKMAITDDSEMKSLFVATLQHTAQNMLRADGNVGITLSGGLDSSTVAGLIAGKLAENGKQLYSYTSVPTAAYKYTNDNQTVENETKFIFDQKQMYDNLCPRFVEYGEKNAFTNIDRFVETFTQPVKPIINMPLIEAMIMAAADDGCKLVFSGGNGNATISYGRIFTYEYQKLKAFHFGEAYRQMNCFCRRFRVSRKRFVKLFWESLVSEKIKPDYMGDSNFLRDDLIKKYRIKPLLKKIQKTRGTGSLDSVQQRRNFCFMPEVFQHMGICDTYLGLKYGVLCLDPTLTRPVIELCMSMPIDFFVKDGKERRAVRDYMRGLVADSILDNFSARGDQAADFAFCVNRDWDKIGSDVLERLKDIRLREYLDNEKLNALVEEIEQNAGKLDRGEVAEAAVICSLGSFLRYIEQIKRK